jgi:hypothetical protein
MSSSLKTNEFFHGIGDELPRPLLVVYGTKGLMSGRLAEHETFPHADG